MGLNKGILLLGFAIIAIGIFVLPSTMSMFVGQHNWFGVQTASDRDEVCRRCHLAEYNEFSANTGAHQTFKDLEHTDSAGCVMCHSVDVSTLNTWGINTTTLSDVAATGTLNFTGDVTDGELVNITISGTTYTFEFNNTGTVTAGYIAVNVSNLENTTAAPNLAAAINSNSSVNASVTATNPTTVTVLLTANTTGDILGTFGNSIGTTENCSNAEWDSTTLAGGLNIEMEHFNVSGIGSAANYSAAWRSTSTPHAAITIDCVDCHWNASQQLLNENEAHTAFYQSTIDGSDPFTANGSTEVSNPSAACIACHTHTSLNVTFIRAIGMDITANHTSGTWNISTYEVNESVYNTTSSFNWTYNESTWS